MGMDEAASCGFEVIDSVFLCYGCRRGTGMLEALPKPEKLVVRTRVPVSKYVVVFQPHDVAALKIQIPDSKPLSCHLSFKGPVGHRQQ